MKKFSLILLLASILLYTGIVGAAHQDSDYDFPDKTITYGQKDSIEVECEDDPTKDCVDTWVNSWANCGSRDPFELDRDLHPDGTDYYKNNVHISPHRLGWSCGWGTHGPLEIWDPSTGNKLAEGGSLTVNAYNMDAHKGKYLFIRAWWDNANPNDYKIETFLLSDDDAPDWDGPAPEWGGVNIEVVQEYDTDGDSEPDRHCVYNNPFDQGARVPASTSESFDGNFPVDSSTGECSTSNGYPGDVFEQTFGSMANKIKRPNHGGCLHGCDDNNGWNMGSYTPLHKDGEYFPQGGLLMGWPPGSWTQGPFWYVCRGSMDGQTRTVSEGNSDDLYRCDTKGNGVGWRDFDANDWEPVAECEDGLDNDNDGDTDYPADTQCDSYSDDTEGDSADVIVPYNPYGSNDLYYFDFSTFTSTDTGYQGDPRSVDDLGNDGDRDIIYQRSGDVYSYDIGSGTENLITTGWAGWHVLDIGGDFDQDLVLSHGPDDAIGYYDFGDDTVKILKRNVDVYGMQPPADVDGDTSSELVIRDSSDLEFAYYDFATNTTDYTSTVGIDDVNNPYNIDGDSDHETAVSDRSSSTLKIYEYNSFSEQSDTGVNVYDIAGWTNLDGDSDREIVFSYAPGVTGNWLKYYDTSTGTVTNLSVYTSSTLGDLTTYGFTSGVCKDPVVGDYEYTTTCFPMGCDTNTEKAAFWDQDAGGAYQNQRTGCRYNNVDVNSTLENSPPATFTCYKDDSVNNIAILDGERRSFCNSISDWKFDDHNSTYQEAVEYHVPKDAIPYGKNQFVESGGWDNDAFQTLHGSWSLTSKSGGAETTYDQPGSFDDFGCDSCHDNATWAAKNMTNLNGYETGTVADYSDAWGVANASGFVNPDVAATTGLINKSDTFPGGFYGKCPAGTIWMKVSTPTGSEWKCSGSIPWDHQAMAPDIQNTPGPDTVGIFLLPWNFREASTFPANITNFLWSFPKAFENARGSKEHLGRLDAVCWTGGLGDKNSSLSGTHGVDWFAVKATGLNQTPYRPIPVYGQLDRSSGNTAYSCEWKFNTVSGGLVKEDAFPDVSITSSNVNSHITQGHIRSAWFTSGITNENDLQNPVDPVNLSALYSDWETYATPGGTYDNTVTTINSTLQ